MKALIWLLAGAVLAIGGLTLYLVSGGYEVGADVPHWPFTARVLETARERSIEQRSGELVVPDLGDESLIRAGAGNYDAMCAGCHLRPGVAETELSAGLNPAPPDLTRPPPDDPAEAFWTIKHGIRLSGMPAWGKHMEDEYIWGVVAFLRRLPAMTQEEYRALVEASGGHSHGEPPATAEPAQQGETHVHEDGSRHQH